MKRLTVRLMALLLMSVSVAAKAADYQVPSWRCGTGLIKTGDSKAKLVKRCGKPDSIESIKKGVKEYSYSSGRQPLTVVTVTKGVVTTITRSR